MEFSFMIPEHQISIENLKTPRIEASAYCRRNPDFTAWETATTTKSKRIRLCGAVTEKELGSVIAKACRFTKNSHYLSAEELIDLAIETGFEETVFLRFIGDNNLATTNGCCSSFAVWRKLYFVKKEYVWLGHTPSPAIEYNENDETVRVWIDDKYAVAKRKEYSMIFTWREFKENLNNLNKDLEDFIVLLETWAETVSPANAKKLSEKFKGYLSVKSFEQY